MAEYTPKRRKIFNQLDEWGVTLDLPRLDNEDNWSYKQRLLDVLVHRANSTYLGLIYGITRELDLDRYKAAQISYSGSGNAPVVEVEDRYLYLYSDYPNTLDATINLWLEASTTNLDRLIYLYELKDKIESYSGWSCTLLADQWSMASNIYNQSSRQIVTNEPVPQSPKFTLQNSGIIDYNVGEDATIWFSDTETFDPSKKKTSATQVTELGDWYIDAATGSVIAYGASNCYVRYEYMEMPYTLLASPVEIYDITSSGVLDILFETETLDDGTTSYVGFTDLGWDVFLELMSVNKNRYWGDD